MAHEFERLHAGKHSIVQELFIKTADENYVAARFCFAHDLNVDFFWNAVHGLEKYLKAALLMNGHSGKDFLANNKRKNEWKRSIEVRDGHMHRAAFLASEQIALMSYLLTDADRDTPNWKLYFALRGAVAHQLPHDQARYRAAAFKSCCAEQELEGEATDIALRWLRQSGLAYEPVG